MPLETRPGDFSKLVSEFMGMVDIQGGFILTEHLSGNWKLIGEEEYPNKMTAINCTAGIFVKFYPPQTGDYAQKYGQTLQQLAGIQNLPYPILLPEALCDGTLIFKAGKHISRIGFEDLAPEAQKEMTKIVAQNGLKPLARFDKLEVVKVGATDYLVDPIEDSVYSISQYSERE